MLQLKIWQWSSIAGIGLAIFSIKGLTWLSSDLLWFDVAAILSIAASVYVGFAWLDGRLNFILIELLVAIVFIVIAALGLKYTPGWLVFGFLAHALWDGLHHSMIKTTVKKWYPPFCAVYDLCIAVFLFIYIYV